MVSLGQGTPAPQDWRAVLCLPPSSISGYLGLCACLCVFSLELQPHFVIACLCVGGKNKSPRVVSCDGSFPLGVQGWLCLLVVSFSGFLSGCPRDYLLLCTHGDACDFPCVLVIQKGRRIFPNQPRSDAPFRRVRRLLPSELFRGDAPEFATDFFF